MKIIYYCQHVLGMGHLFRSLEICRAFAGHDVILVTGGAPIDAPLPSHVREVRLSGLMMDEEFSNLYATEPGKSLLQVKSERKERLLDLFKTEAPDLFIVELYPFGRNAFRFEIDPILQGIKSGDLPRSHVICSLRDILVEKKDQVAYEARVAELLNRYFDVLLVHADPQVLKLEETFSRVNDIHVPVYYTGFVTAKPAPGAGARLRKELGIQEEDVLCVASAGGGTVGNTLLQAVVSAFALMNTHQPRQLYVFTGPFLRNDDFECLRGQTGSNVQVFRFTPDFLSYLAAADLSVSMAGYNTCMNIVATGVPALVWPFPQNREQGLRAQRLAQLGVLRVLTDTELMSRRLIAAMEESLALRRNPACAIDLDGAEKTARWLGT